MEVTVERRDGGMVALSIEVDAEGVGQAVAQVYREYGKRLSVPGFRKGKVPPQILERYLSKEEAAEQAIEDLANQGYRKAIQEHDLAPVGRATLENTEKREDGSVVITATVPVRPEVKLGPYKGLKATQVVPEVTDEHVAAELEKLRARHAEYRSVDDRAVQQGDLAIVDVALLIEGERHDQGSAAGYPLEVGSDNLFPELNESLVGARVGEERRVPVNYPADFHRPELAGKSGEFVVTVREIKERVLPELSDEFVRRQTSISSVEKLRERVRKSLEAVAEALAESNLRNDLLGQVVEASQLDLPAEPVEREVARRAAAAQEEVERQGVSLESYLARRGLTEQAWQRSLAVEARNDLRRALVLDAVGQAEKIQPTDKEIERELAEQAREEGRTPEQVRRRLERADDLDRIVNRVYHRKVMEFLVRNAEVTSETASAQETGPEQPAQPEATPQP